MIAVEIYGRDMKVDDALHDYVETRASKLDRFMETIEGARVDFIFRKGARMTEQKYKSQITLHGKGFTLRSEERSDQAQNAFDVALDKIQRQIERYKGKHSWNKRDKASIMEAVADATPAEGESGSSPIARRKRFLLHPMNEDEALEQMRLLSHEDFFVFYNMDTAGVSVLYKRGDGNYGLIDTELA